MILDSSALIAVLCREPGYEALVKRMAQADRLEVGAPTLVETEIVLTARGLTDARSALMKLIWVGRLRVTFFGSAHATVAAGAFARFGKGRHRASLNFGDCLSYATAKLANRPLLFVGADFSETDLPAGLADPR